MSQRVLRGCRDASECQGNQSRKLVKSVPPHEKFPPGGKSLIRHPKQGPSMRMGIFAPFPVDSCSLRTSSHQQHSATAICACLRQPLALAAAVGHDSRPTINCARTASRPATRIVLLLFWQRAAARLRCMKPAAGRRQLSVQPPTHSLFQLDPYGGDRVVGAHLSARTRRPGCAAPGLSRAGVALAGGRGRAPAAGGRHTAASSC